MKITKQKLIDDEKLCFSFLKAKSYKPKANKGFTLIETMVAIFILVVSIGGPLTLVAKGLTASFFARDQITAFFLAQEAVEYVRNIRDRNTFEGNGWIDGFAGCFGGNVCDIDVQNDTVISCSGTCPPLLLNSVTGFFNHDSGNASPFTREVTLTSVTADEVAVSVTISWVTGVLSRSFVIKEHIFNWQQGGGGAPAPGPIPCGANQADDLIVDISSAGIGGPGQTRLNGITLSNTCATASVTITDIQIIWGNGENLERIQIDGASAWSGSQSSGPFTDIANYTVAPSALGVPIDFFGFSGDMNGDTFDLIVFLMSDGSSDVVGPLSP